MLFGFIDERGLGAGPALFFLITDAASNGMPQAPQEIKRQMCAQLAGGPGFYSADIGTTIGCPVPSRFVRRGGYHGRRQRSGYATRS
jgi:hypothetical protein